MEAKILSVRTKEKNASLIILEINKDGKKTKYTISEGTYREIGCPLSGEFIYDDALEMLSRDDEERRALTKALSLLSYADNNERGLYMKLLRAGYKSEIARETVKECVRLGYVNEERQAERFILKAAEELIGPYKISAKLISRGYPSALVFSIISRLEATGEIDFKEAKLKLIKARLPEEYTEEEKRKLLHRYGYIK